MQPKQGPIVRGLGRFVWGMPPDARHSFCADFQAPRVVGSSAGTEDVATVNAVVNHSLNYMIRVLEFDQCFERRT